MDITATGEVWCADVTYLPMARGFCYLVAVMDWASGRVLSFRLSNTLGLVLHQGHVESHTARGRHARHRFWACGANRLDPAFAQISAEATRS